MQSLAHQGVVGVVVLHVGVGEVETVVEYARLAENQIFFARLEAVFNPFQALKPYQFNGAGIVGECGRNPRNSRSADALHIAYRAYKLIVDIVVADLPHLMDLRAVDIPEREVIHEVLKRVNAELLVQQLSPFRSHALKVFYFRLKQIHYPR